MSRRILFVTLTAGAALALAIPAVARTPTTHSHSRLSLVMGGRVGAVIGAGRSAVADATPGAATVTYQGFRCQVTIGQGLNDTIYHNHIVFDSTEFYVPHNSQNNSIVSVTTNCIGRLAPGTVVAPTIVSAPTAHCGQINPFDKNKFIVGTRDHDDVPRRDVQRDLQHSALSPLGDPREMAMSHDNQTEAGHREARDRARRAVRAARDHRLRHAVGADLSGLNPQTDSLLGAGS